MLKKGILTALLAALILIPGMMRLPKHAGGIPNCISI